MSADLITPFHVEAYPTIDLREARSHVREGRNRLLWRDQDGSLVGIAALAFDPANILTITAQFRHLWYIAAGSFKHSLACEVISRDEGQDDVLVSSGGNGERRRVIVFADGAWRSQFCQRLAYRSTIVSASVRATERLAELDLALAEGRPRYLRVGLYQELLRERSLLRRQLGDRRAVPPLHQRHQLYRS